MTDLKAAYERPPGVSLAGWIAELQRRQHIADQIRSSALAKLQEAKTAYDEARAESLMIMTVLRQAKADLATRTWTLGSPDGWVGKSYEASDAETASKLAEADGYAVLDVMDHTLVVADK